MVEKKVVSISEEAGLATHKMKEIDNISGEAGDLEVICGCNPTDKGNANRLVAYYGNKVRYCEQMKSWFVYNGKRWVRDEVIMIQELAKDTVSRIIFEVGFIHDADPKTEREEQERLTKWANRSESGYCIREMIRLAQSDDRIGILAEEFDAQTNLMNFPNGTLDMDTGEFREHRLEDMLSKITKVPYEPECKCDYFYKTLLTALPLDIAVYLQRILGSCLTYTTKEKMFVVLYGKPYAAKCLWKGTKVIKLDGRLCNIEDLNVGDKLMGPDSKPRTVLETTEGVGPLYKIKQFNGLDYVVNDAHILTLKKASWVPKLKGERYNSGNYRRPRGILPNEPNIIDIPIPDYIKKSGRWRKHYYGFKVGVEYPSTKQSIDPYYLGLWLGDGHSHSSAITTADKEIVSHIYAISKEEGISVTTHEKIGNKARVYHVTEGRGNSRSTPHLFFKKFKHYNLINNKHIPDDYLYASREQRLALLAGIIDSDGSKNREGYAITQKNEVLAKQIIYLCNSLGFSCSCRKRTAKIKELNFVGEYWYLHLSGNLSIIPVKLPRKKIDLPKDGRRLCRIEGRTGIKVEAFGEGAWAGVVLDGDGRFLLEDFTVTHNSSITQAVYGSLGDYAKPFQLSLIQKKRNPSSSSAAQPELIALEGARIAWSEELSEDFIYDDSMVKSLTSSGERSTRDVYEKQRTIKLGMTIVIETNKAPLTDVEDDWQRQALMNRMSIIPFLKTIPPAQRDTKVFRMTTEDKTELTAALAWVLQGYFDNKAYGNQVPDSVNMAKEGYERDVNPLASFINEELVFEDSEGYITRTLNSELYTRFKENASHDEIVSMRGAKGFAKWFRKIAPYYAKKVDCEVTSTHTREGLAWNNVRLRDESDEPLQEEIKIISPTGGNILVDVPWALEDYNKHIKEEGFGTTKHELVNEEAQQEEVKEVKAHPLIDQATFAGYVFAVLEGTKNAKIRGLSPIALKELVCSQIKHDHPEYIYWGVEKGYDTLVNADPEVQDFVVTICGTTII